MQSSQQSLTDIGCSELQKIISKYPDLNWDWDSLSYNLSLSAEFLISNISKPLNMCKLSANPVISAKHLDLYPFVAWKYEGYSINLSMPSEIIKYGINKRDITDTISLVNWNYYYLSLNPAIECEYIRDNISQPWNWEAISRREDLTEQFSRDYEVFLAPTKNLSADIDIDTTIAANNRGDFLDNYWSKYYPDNLVYLEYLRDENARKRLKTFIKESRRNYYKENPSATIDLSDIDWNMVSLFYNKITVDFFEKYRGFLNLGLLSKNTACYELQLYSAYAKKIYYVIQFAY